MVDAISAELTKKVATTGGVEGLGGGLKPDATFKNDQSSFAKLLDSQMQTEAPGQVNNDKLVSMAESIMGSNQDTMKAIPGSEIKLDTARVGEIEGTKVSKSEGIFEIFKQINGDQIGMDNLVESLTSGKKFSTMEMMRIQVLMQNNSLGVDLFSKGVDMAHKGVSSVFNMQVG